MEHPDDIEAAVTDAAVDAIMGQPAEVRLLLCDRIERHVRQESYEKGEQLTSVQRAISLRRIAAMDARRAEVAE